MVRVRAPPVRGADRADQQRLRAFRVPCARRPGGELASTYSLTAACAGRGWSSAASQSHSPGDMRISAVSGGGCWPQLAKPR